MQLQSRLPLRCFRGAWRQLSKPQQVGLCTRLVPVSGLFLFGFGLCNIRHRGDSGRKGVRINMANGQMT
jgi:hypothetical protein